MLIPLKCQIRITLKAISNQRDSIKYRVEPENIKSNDNDLLNWLSIVRNVTPSFLSVSYNLHAPIWRAPRKREEGGGGFFKFTSERGFAQ